MSSSKPVCSDEPNFVSAWHKLLIAKGRNLEMWQTEVELLLQQFHVLRHSRFETRRSYKWSFKYVGEVTEWGRPVQLEWKY